MRARALRTAKAVLAAAADRAYGIRTTAQIGQAQLGYPAGSDCLHYQASSWLSVPVVFRSWAPKPGPGDVLLDLGCGKGRALVQIARRFALDRVIGLEHSPALAEWARINLDRTRARHKARTFEVVVNDARSWEVPDDVTVVYLANPFVGQVFAEALDRVVESHDRQPRRMRIAYVNPAEHAQVLATGRARELPRPNAHWMRWAGVDPEQFRCYEIVGG